jgi:hypothetical protein
MEWRNRDDRCIGWIKSESGIVSSSDVINNSDYASSDRIWALGWFGIVWPISLIHSGMFDAIAYHDGQRYTIVSFSRNWPR